MFNQSGAALQGIVEGVQRVSSLMGEIAGAAREQSLGVDQVNLAVTHMDTVTQRNAAQTEELTATAKQVETVASELAQAISYFHLGGVGEAAPPPASSVGRRPPPRPSVRPLAPRASQPSPHAGGFVELDSHPAALRPGEF